MKKIRAVYIAVFLLLASSTQVEGASFRSTLGFAFDYPDDWIHATKDNRDAALKDVHSRINIRNVEFGRVVVIVFDPAGDCAWCPSVNVEVLPQARTGRLTQATADDVVNGIRSQFRSLGITPTVLTGKLESFGGKHAASIRLDVTYPGQSFQLSQWQVIFPGAWQAYYVNSSAKTTDWDRYKPIFEAILNSFKGDLAPGGQK